MKIRSFLFCACLALFLLAACTGALESKPGSATVTITFDMGTGGSGFTAMIYAQEVSSGKTFHVVMPSSSHGGVILPTSPPLSLTVEAPGTYVFYAVLINADRHYGATGCQALTDCPSSDLVALDVEAGKSYEVYIGDWKAKIPPTGVPVDVPWHK